MTKSWFSTIAVVFTLAATAPVFAESEGHEQTHHGHEYHVNTLYGFFGITGEDRRDRAGTIAIEYERRINKRWGLAVGAEHAFGDLDFTVFTIPVVFHSGQWALYAGPGLEKASGHDDELLFRVGVAYEFEVGKAIFAPKFNVDFVDGDAVLVGGLAIGFGF